MKFTKKLLSLLLALAMLFTMTAGIDLSAYAANGVSQKLNSLKSSYPSGRYWNHYVSNSSECIDNLNHDENKFSRTTTTHPCNGHGISYTVGLYDCNAFQGGEQCWGFANLIFNSVFGQKATSLSRRYDTSNVAVGDWVRLLNDSHSAVVLSKSGSTITVVECNNGGTCKIDWGTSYSTSQITYFYHASNYDSINGMASKPAKPTNLNVQTTNEKLNISWNASAGATSYIVYIYSKGNCSEYVYKQEVTTTYINNISVKPGRYWIYVHAINSAGASEGCGPFNYLGCPTNVGVNHIGDKLKVTWDAVQGANCYDVIVTDPSGTTNWYHTDKAEKEFAVSKVGTYTIDVQSLYRENGSTTGQIVGAHSKVVTYNVSSTESKLTIPTLKAVVNTNGTFTLSWNKVTGADKYEIYYDNGTGYKLLGSTTDTSKTTGVAVYGKKYSYKVRAVNNSNSSITSEFSNVVSATNTNKLQTPTAKAVVNTNGSFTISWNTITGADKYEIYYDNGTGYKLLGSTTATSKTTGVATYGKKYSYKVRAVTSKNSSATSNYSNVVSATNTKKLQTPTAKVVVNTNGTFTLSWNKVTNADKYEIYIKQANGSYKLMKTTADTSSTTAIAAYGKQYSYKVRALNSKNTIGASEYSSVVSATNTNKLQTPTMIAIINANGTFTLTWNAISGADKYEIYIKQANGTYKLMKTTTETSYTTATATKGKTYSYILKAVSSKNSSASSNYSSVVNAKR
ncbi:MAG: hypothetical protein K2F65_00210 [Eubacterium sp.]|nr:hypothetical protein [Eubacterium sp.]